MSADLLRQAAALMREDWSITADMTGITLTDPHWRRGKTWLAVADWLEEVAERQKPTQRWIKRSHGWTGARLANAVARAYLGDQP